MNLVKELKIELTADQAEKIVADYIEGQMEQNGYTLTFSSNEDGPWPNTFWRGTEIEGWTPNGDH